MWGNATLTTLMSSTTISWLRHAAARASAGRLLVAFITTRRIAASGARPLCGFRNCASTVRRVTEVTSQLCLSPAWVYACGVVHASAVGVERALRELAQRLDDEIDEL